MNGPIDVRRHAHSILEVTGKIVDRIDEESAAAFRRHIGEADQVFVAGAGRTGYVALCFAMRLMHLGLRVHVVGDATAPAPTASDLLLAFSGSGESLSTCEVATRAADRGIPICAVTARSDSRLGKTANHRLIIPETDTDLPLGTLFESALYTFLDATILSLMDELQVQEGEMSTRHALG